MINAAESMHCDKPLQFIECPRDTRGGYQPHANGYGAPQSYGTHPRGNGIQSLRACIYDSPGETCAITVIAGSRARSGDNIQAVHTH